MKIRSGDKTPIEQIPTPDLAVPYAAPRSIKVSKILFEEKLKNTILTSKNKGGSNTNESKESSLIGFSESRSRTSLGNYCKEHI